MYDLIFDRKTSDVTNNLLKGSYNASDLNRVEEWCKYLADELNTLGYSINITTKTNWTYSGDTGTIRKKSDMTRIKNNILALMNGYHYISTIYSSVDNWNITKANRWEKILYEIYCMMSGMENYYVLSGVGYSGEPRLWQNRLIQTYEGYPKSYEAIPYCQSTGTQYINLDTYSCSDERIVIDFEFTALGQCYIYGNNYSTHLISVGLDANNKFAYQYKGTLTTTNTTAVIGTRYVLDLTLKNGTQTLKINGAVVGTSTIADTNRAYSSNKQGLFYKRSSSSSAQLPASIKLYSCRIYNFDVLYQDIVPCKNSDNVTCLWEKVYNKLYENAGSGEFLPSEDVGDALLTENGQAITTEVGEAIDFESVPYTMLDWIESTGTQYIDTGIIPSNNIKVETKLSLISPAYCGSEKTPNDGRFKWGGNGQNIIYYGYGTQNHNISATTGINIPYTYYMARGEQWVKNESGTIVASSTDASITTYSTTPILLFALMTSGSITYSKVMRIYYCKIWNGDTLVRDFIPVLDETNQTPCLYDKVTETYFYNQGTGNFAPSETTTYRTLNYLQSTGTQYIDVGVSTDTNSKVAMNLQFTNSGTQECLYSDRDYPNGVASNQFSLFKFAGSKMRIDYGSIGSQFTLSVDTTSLYRLEQNKNNFYSNGTLIHTNSTATFTTTNPMRLLAARNYDSTNNFASVKLYSVDVSNNNVMQSLLIPVIRKSDNEPCLYDLVNDTFYTNAGTGTFLYG